MLDEVYHAAKEVNRMANLAHHSGSAADEKEGPRARRRYVLLYRVVWYLVVQYLTVRYLHLVPYRTIPYRTLCVSHGSRRTDLTCVRENGPKPGG